MHMLITKKLNQAEDFMEQNLNLQKVLTNYGPGHYHAVVSGNGRINKLLQINKGYYGIAQIGPHYSDAGGLGFPIEITIWGTAYRVSNRDIIHC